MPRDRKREQHERRQHEQAVKNRRKKIPPEQEKIPLDSFGIDPANGATADEPGNYARTLEDFIFRMQNNPELAAKYLVGALAVGKEDFTVAGRFRSKNTFGDHILDESSFIPSREADAYFRKRQYEARKLEEGDLEKRHHVPPEERFMEFVARYGERRALDHILEVLTEQEDLENFMDILEPTAEHDARRRSMDHRTHVSYMRRKDEY